MVVVVEGAVGEGEPGQRPDLLISHREGGRFWGRVREGRWESRGKVWETLSPAVRVARRKRSSCPKIGISVPPLPYSLLAPASGYCRAYSPVMKHGDNTC